MLGSNSLWFPLVVLMAATLLGSCLFGADVISVCCGWRMWITAQRLCSFFSFGTIEIHYLFSYMIRICFCNTDTKMPRPLLVNLLHSGGCHVQEGCCSQVFPYCLKFPFQANVAQVFSVVPLTQFPMGMLVHLASSSYCLKSCVCLEVREHWFSPLPQS